MNDLKKLIREVPDYPKPGILFYDLTTLLKDKRGFHTLIDRLCEHYNGHTIDIVAGIEARIYFRAGAGISAGSGFCPGAQAEEAPRQDGKHFLRARVWHGHTGDSRRRGEAGST